MSVRSSPWLVEAAIKAIDADQELNDQAEDEQTRFDQGDEVRAAPATWQRGQDRASKILWPVRDPLVKPEAQGARTMPAL